MKEVERCDPHGPTVATCGVTKGPEQRRTRFITHACATPPFHQTAPDGDGDGDGDGAGDGQPAAVGAPRRRRSQISTRQYYAHRLQVRELLDANGDVRDGADGHPLLDDALNRAGRLFQEYCCMALAKTEQQKLRWLQRLTSMRTRRLTTISQTSYLTLQVRRRKLIDDDPAATSCDSNFLQ